MMGKPTTAERDHLVREAEERVWRSAGVTPSEHRVRLEPYGIDARVQEVGTGPPVLFVHGASNGGASWAPLLGGLDGLRCLALDRPGNGLSDPLRTDLTDINDLESYADRLIVSVLDALEIERASIVATSYGGYFALRGAAANPERIDRMVLFGWSIGAPMTKVPLVMRVGFIPGLGRLMARMPVSRRSVRMMLRQVGLRAALESGRFTDEALDWMVAVLRHTDTLGNEQRNTPRVILPIRGINERVLLTPQLLAGVGAPTYFLWGEDDPNGGAEVARSFTSLVPNAELELRTGVGHAPWIDEPEYSAEIVNRFLKPSPRR